ncbi:MAG: hypothetical protein R3C03_07510 [Pirellulaceae bacterium]
MADNAQSLESSSSSHTHQSQSSSRWKPLSNGRRLVCDVIRMAKKIPLAGVLADLNVEELSEIRKQVRPRIAWNVLLMKAYAIVAVDRPELRQLYAPWPWAHLYEHPRNVCLMTFSREHEGEERLFFGRFNSPEHCSLLELQERYDEYREAPVESIKQFRHQIRFAKFPGPVRRLGWWLMRDLWVRKAASHMGTFGMSISGFKDAFGTSHIAPNTTTLGVDVITRGGKSRTLLTFDHRVLDGKPAIDILAELGRVLRGPIVDELLTLRDQASGDRRDQSRAKESSEDEVATIPMRRAA